MRSMRDVLGQARALETLRRALSSERLHHAWVFAGPMGVGKFTTAIEFARILLDPAARRDEAGWWQGDPDGETRRLIDAGSHPDLHVIRKELARYVDDPRMRQRKLTTIPVDVLRAHMIGGTVGQNGRYVEPAVSHTPARGHGKVFVIDEAELLDATGQNALLKTLEEPPRATTIILVTSRPERLLPTIRSRCQMVRFERLTADAMRTWLERSGAEVPADQRAWIDVFADGSPGLATLGLEHGLAAWAPRLQPMLEALEQGRFPGGLGGALGELVEAFAQSWVKGDANRSKDAANKAGAGHAIALLAAHARRRLREEAGRPGAEPDALERWTAVIEVLRETESLIQSNVNLKQALEGVVVLWAAAQRAPRAVFPSI